MTAGVRRLWLMGLGLSIVGAAPVVAADVPSAVAVICRIDGSVMVVHPGSDPTSARLLERLEPGTEARVPDSARLEIVYFEGSRFGVVGEATAVIGEKEPVDVNGKVVHLGTVATKPALAPLANAEAIGADTAVTVIRGTEADAGELALEPAQGGSTLAHETVLRFTPIRGAERCEIYVEHHPDLERVFTTETDSTEVALPDDVLVPGEEYYWSVRTLPPRRPVVRGGAVFHTVTKDQAAHREALAKDAAQTDDAALWVLLAGLDLSLGLDREACDALFAAGPSATVVELAFELGCGVP